MADTQLLAIEEPVTTLLTVNCLLRPLAWEPSVVVGEALTHHAARGDLQTSVSVLLVLGEKRKSLESTVTQLTQEHWLLAYIDLLSRHKLWNVCTQVREKVNAQLSGSGVLSVQKFCSFKLDRTFSRQACVKRSATGSKNIMLVVFLFLCCQILNQYKNDKQKATYFRFHKCSILILYNYSIMEKTCVFFKFMYLAKGFVFVIIALSQDYFKCCTYRDENIIFVCLAHLKNQQGTVILLSLCPIS